MDLLIINNTNYVESNLYDKKELFNFDVKTLINWKTCMARRIVSNTLCSQIIRIANICSKQNYFEENFKKLLDKFLENDVPKRFLEYHLQKICIKWQGKGMF